MSAARLPCMDLVRNVPSAAAALGVLGVAALAGALLLVGAAGAASQIALILVGAGGLVGCVAVLLWRQRALTRQVAECTAALAGATSTVRDRDARLRLAIEAAGLGSWEIDLRAGTVTRAGKVVPPRPGVPLTGGSLERYFEDVVHPDDRALPQTAMADLLAGRTGSYRVEYRVRRPDGGWRFMESFGGLVERDPATGEALRVAGVSRDVTERRMAEAALRDGEERLRLAQEAGGIGCWDWEVATGALHWSESCHSLHGTDPDVPPSLEAWLAGIHPEDGARVATVLKSPRQAGGAGWETEFRFIRPTDGQVRWIVYRGSGLLPDPATGEPQRVLGVALDITDRKVAENRLRLMALELDHRAKNILAVVQATVRLTARDDADSYARAIEGRVRALARAHSFLAEGGRSGAELRSLAVAELAPFLGGPDDDPAAPRLTLEGPGLRLSPAAAQALSMSIHELATNAAKYGALSAPGGRAKLGWTVDRAAARLRLRWAEQGGPRVAGPPTRQGFGTRVLDASVRDQLGGQVEWRWGPAGLVCIMTMPLGRVQGMSPVEMAAE